MFDRLRAATDTPGSVDAQFFARVFAVTTAAILLKTGFLVHRVLPPLGSHLRTGLLFAIYLTAFVFLCVAAVGIDFDRWGRYLGGLVTALLFAAVATAYLTKSGSSFLGTDAILFTRYSVDLLMQGQNPYAHSMLPAFEKYPVAEQFVTYKTNSDIVTSVSYPALAFLVYLPQALLDIPNLNLTTIVIFLAVYLFLYWETPARYSFLPATVLFVDPSLVMFSFGGVFDILWVLPVLVGMRFWYQRRLAVAAALFGLAFAVKQTPWFLGPFFVVWLYHTSATWTVFKRAAGTCLAAGLAGFLAPNLPFIIWDVNAWVSSVLTPVLGGGAPLVKQGAGLTLVSVGNLYYLPKTVFTVGLLGGLLVALTAYTMYFPYLRDLMWVVPPALLWLNYRSLQNYYVFFIPVAYAVILYANRYKQTITTDQVTVQIRDRIRWTGAENWYGVPGQVAEHPGIRRVAVIGVTVLMVTTTVAAGVTFHQDTTMDADAEVVGYNTSSYRTVETLTVRVTNNESQVIEPVFNVMYAGRSTHQYWDVESGPRRLRPGETGTYTITAPTASLTIPFQTKVVLGVNDRGTELQTKIGPLSFNGSAYTSVLNPGFETWELPYGAEQESPVEWRRTSSDHGGERTVIQQASNGVRLTVLNRSRQTGPWAMAGIQQTAPFPETVTVTATPNTVVDGAPRYPANPTGVELIESTHRIWLIFSDVEERRTRVRSSGELSYTLVFIPAESGETVTATVNVTAIYEDRGWRYPSSTTTTVNGQTYERRLMRFHPFAALSKPTNRTADIIVQNVSTTPGFTTNRTKSPT